MSNPHIYALEHDFVAPVAVTSNTAAAGRPAENVLSWARPNRLFVGTGDAADEWVTIDFGLDQTTLGGLFIDGCNAKLMVVQGNATDSWGSPTYSETFAVSDPTGVIGAWGRNRIFCKLLGTAWESTGFRYLRVRTTAVGSHDGSGVLKIGSLLPCEVNLSSDTFGWPLQVEMIEPSTIQERFAAPPEVSIIGDKRFGLVFTQPATDESIDRFAQDILGMGVGRHILFARNNGKNEEAWLMRRVNRAYWSQDGPRLRSLQNVAFEEVA